MLNIKSRDKLVFYKESFASPPVKVEVDTKVRDNAKIVDSKIAIEK